MIVERLAQPKVDDCQVNWQWVSLVRDSIAAGYA
jgi:hypothetical protein